MQTQKLPKGKQIEIIDVVDINGEVMTFKRDDIIDVEFSVEYLKVETKEKVYLFVGLPYLVVFGK